MIERLAVYGSLRPGEKNHRQLAGLKGEWRPGIVRGWLVECGWGAAAGYPGIRPDPNGPEVAVQVFASRDLADHWARLDAFEGEEYERVPVSVTLGGETVEAQIYALREAPDATR